MDGGSLKLVVLKQAGDLAWLSKSLKTEAGPLPSLKRRFLGAPMLLCHASRPNSIRRGSSIKKVLNAPDIPASLWQSNKMQDGTISREMSRKLIDSLYVEAMVMADEARGYFDAQADMDREALDIMVRVSFSCESLKVTTRLMHIIAWLLTQRAVLNGELHSTELSDPRHQLGDTARSDPGVVARFPFAARSLIEASQDLYDRVARLQGSMIANGEIMPMIPSSPARQLLDRLERSF